MTSLYPLLIVLVVAWGAFAFGAVYEWAYVPLLWGCSALGVIGLVSSRPEGLLHRGTGPLHRRRGRIHWPIAGAIALLAAAIGLQLIPLAPDTLARISPATDRFLANYDVAYAAARATGTASYRHALSIDPAGTVARTRVHRGLRPVDDWTRAGAGKRGEPVSTGDCRPRSRG